MSTQGVGGQKKGQILKKRIYFAWSALIYKWSLGIKAAKSKIVV
jgi:hypothetical protein